MILTHFSLNKHCKPKTKRMKNVHRSTTRCNGPLLSVSRSFYGITHHTVFVFCTLLMTGLLFTGCQKESAGIPAVVEQNMAQAAGRPTSNALNQYTGLSTQT